jgi:hypothetical protein
MNDLQFIALPFVVKLASVLDLSLMCPTPHGSGRIMTEMEGCPAFSPAESWRLERNDGGRRRKR